MGRGVNPVAIVDLVGVGPERLAAESINAMNSLAAFGADQFSIRDVNAAVGDDRARIAETDRIMPVDLETAGRKLAQDARFRPGAVTAWAAPFRPVGAGPPGQPCEIASAH